MGQRNYQPNVLLPPVKLGRCVWSLLTLLLLCTSALQMRAQSSGQSQQGSISGMVTDASAASVRGARVTLSLADQSQQKTITGDDGRFVFSGIAPGPFQISVDAAGFASKTITATLHPGEQYNSPILVLAVASANIEVRVGLSQVELAQAQIHDEEKQRLLGVLPNFYVTYNPKAAPLDAKQKFQLATRATIDPVSFAVTGIIAGVEQANNNFGGYGQGAEGYAKRYGAAYADFVSGVFIGGAVLPALLHQDPRYFVKGTGTKQSRLLYALANAFIRKGDNGRWQPDYSGILGGLASGGISNLYYPAQNRNGAALTFENAGLGIVGTAVGNVVQEFFFRKITPHACKPAQP